MGSSLHSLPKAYQEGLARVSDIVSQVWPFEGENRERFLKWLASHNVTYDTYMEAACSAGTAIHLSLEQYIKRKKVISSFPGYTQAGKDFLRDLKVTKPKTEVYVVSRHFQGTIDLVCEIDGENWIVDWKTWAIAKKILSIPTSSTYKKPYEKLKKTALQLSLYAYATGIQNIAVVELMDGEYRFHPLKRMTDAEVEDIITDFRLSKLTGVKQTKTNG